MVESHGPSHSFFSGKSLIPGFWDNAISWFSWTPPSLVYFTGSYYTQLIKAAVFLSFIPIPLFLLIYLSCLLWQLWLTLTCQMARPWVSHFFCWISHHIFTCPLCTTCIFYQCSISNAASPKQNALSSRAKSAPPVFLFFLVKDDIIYQVCQIIENWNHFRIIHHFYTSRK